MPKIASWSCESDDPRRRSTSASGPPSERDRTQAGVAAGVRIDKWLWAARFFKTRGLAQGAVEAGHVLVGGERVKLSRPVRVGDALLVRTALAQRTVRVLAVSDVRGPAPVAQRLYEETPESIRLRVEAQSLRALNAEPAQAIEQGRPTKRERRALERLRSQRW